MKTRILLAALPLMMIAGAALAEDSTFAQRQDGCVRLPSSSALVIVIPREGCGTARMAEARGDSWPVVIYGVSPPAEVTPPPGDQLVPYVVHNIAISVSSAPKRIAFGKGKRFN